MKTLRRIVAVGLLLGSYQLGFAQSNGVSPSSAQLEKKAMKEAHQAEMKQKNSGERFASDAEKEAYKKAHPATVAPASKPATASKQAGVKQAQRIDMKDAQTSQPAAPVRATNANVAAKRLPANYTATETRTSKSEQ